ncbi:MAG: pilus assembly protein TadG-related protein [Novosphingobium sp.]|jgi:Flp pilus assembly protein TadG|uniref:pilus assembly protein TadG-related protein n=1 Tax=Novosphingobium sp. TaxID=1874826 RepID=UPI00391BFE5E
MPGSSRRGFIAEEGGAIAPTFAIGLFVLVGMAGISFDYARLATLDTELQTAADQAALAAASQLDGNSGAITRATNAASGLVTNKTIFGENGGTAVAIAAPTFYKSYNSDTDTFGATTTVDSEASVVKVAVVARKAFYALTPVIGLFNSGDINAEAVAGLGSSICKIPPLMICNPNESSSLNFPLPSDRGKGVKLEAGGGSGTWGPGNYGYLDFGSGAKDLQEALGANSSVDNCLDQSAISTKPGNTASATVALNTRFDIYDNGLTGYCTGTTCSPALNTRKDLIRKVWDPKDSCGVGNGWGTDPWMLPARQYVGLTSPVPENMGLPRDVCHAVSSNGTCSGGRFGNGDWHRQLYFNVNHGGLAASVVQTWAGRATLAELSRYDVYKWEMATAGRLDPRVVANRKRLSAQGKEIGPLVDYYSYSAPKCAAGVGESSTQKDRRVLTVAVVNCQANSVQGSTSLSGKIIGWADFFLVEPSINRTYTNKDQIYAEVIGPAERPGGGSAFQYYQRQQPRLYK